MSEVSLKELQNCELEILKTFIDVCETLGLKYYLLGGTLLGAVRHKGFIPWDDDIDVGMLRDDYECFVAEGQKLMPDYYFLQTHHTDPQWPANFAKIRDCRTTFVESSVKNRRINHGVYIDIFPLDFFSSDSKVEKKFVNKNRLMVQRISRVFTMPQKGIKLPLWKRCARCALSIASYIRHPSLTATLNARDKLFRSISSGGLIANHCGAWGKKEIVPAEWYGEGKMLEFEGLSVRGPLHYDKWLSQVYGDYMQLPPVEKRIAHHYVEVIDLNASYAEIWRKER